MAQPPIGGLTLNLSAEKKKNDKPSSTLDNPFNMNTSSKSNKPGFNYGTSGASNPFCAKGSDIDTFLNGSEYKPISEAVSHSLEQAPQIGSRLSHNGFINDISISGFDVNLMFSTNEK